MINPRALATWSAAALVVVLTGTNPVYRALVLLVALNLLLAHRRSDAPLRPLFIAIAVASVVAVLVNVLLSHTGAHTIVEIPGWIPGIGGAITVESVIYGGDVALGLAAAVLAVAPLSRVLHPHDLIDALPGVLQRTAALIGAAVNLVPAMARNAVAISEAQRMRGGRRTRLRDWHASAAPIVISALDDSLQLAEAMDARGFGSGPRTRFAARPLDAAALLVIAGAIGAALLTVVARSTGALADWYPFPVATLPPTAALPILACTLLAIPLVAWRRS